MKIFFSLVKKKNLQRKIYSTRGRKKIFLGVQTPLKRLFLPPLVSCGDQSFLFCFLQEYKDY